MRAKSGFLSILRWAAENLARTAMHALLKGVALNGCHGSSAARGWGDRNRSVAAVR